MAVERSLRGTLAAKDVSPVPGALHLGLKSYVHITMGDGLMNRRVSL